MSASYSPGELVRCPMLNKHNAVFKIVVISGTFVWLKTVHGQSIVIADSCGWHIAHLRRLTPLEQLAAQAQEN